MFLVHPKAIVHHIPIVEVVLLMLSLAYAEQAWCISDNEGQSRISYAYVIS